MVILVILSVLGFINAYFLHWQYLRYKMKNKPSYIRALVYQYNFTTPEERKKTGAIWKRRYVDEYFPAVSLDSPELKSTVSF